MPEAIPPQIDELRRRARRRLVGAIVLALAAAVLVPMLLETDPKPLGEDVSVKIPPIDDGKFVNKVGEKARAAEPPAKSAPSPSAPVAAKESWREPAKDPATPQKPASEAPKASPPEVPPLAAPPKPAVAETSKGTGTPVASSKPAPQSPGGAFNVQLAAFSDDKGANALANKLKTAGHAAYVEPYNSSRGTLWRVRVGPFPTQAAAQAAQATLKAEGHSGIIPPAN